MLKNRVSGDYQQYKQTEGADPQHARFLLDILDQRTRDLVLARGLTQHYRNHECLIRHGDMIDGIYIIMAGTVESLYENDGCRGLMLATWQQGDFIGAPYVLGSHRHAWTARAVGPVETLWLDQACLTQLVAESPGFAFALIECLGYKGERYSRLAQVLATHKAGERLALLLLELCRSSAPLTNTTVKVPLIKQDKLAKMIGATRQSVSLALQKLEESGAISVGVDSYFVHAPDALARHAGLDRA